MTDPRRSLALTLVLLGLIPARAGAVPSATTVRSLGPSFAPPKARFERNPGGFAFRWLAEGDDGLGAMRATLAYAIAHQKARIEAAALAAGEARLYSHGFLGMSAIDPETGLASERIVGCVVGAEVLGRAEGNNGLVRARTRANGPAANSLLPWEETLLALPAYFEARAKAGATFALRIGGPTLVSPDGRFAIRQVSARFERGTPPDRREVTEVGLAVEEREGDRDGVGEVLTDDWTEGLTDLAWGPFGAPFAVVKCRDKDGPEFRVLHLRPADWVTTGELTWRRHLRDHPEDR